MGLFDQIYRNNPLQPLHQHQNHLIHQHPHQPLLKHLTTTTTTTREFTMNESMNEMKKKRNARKRGRKDDSCEEDKEDDIDKRSSHEKIKLKFKTLKIAKKRSRTALKSMFLKQMETAPPAPRHQVEQVPVNPTSHTLRMTLDPA